MSEALNSHEAVWWRQGVVVQWLQVRCVAVERVASLLSESCPGVGVALLAPQAKFTQTFACKS